MMISMRLHMRLHVNYFNILFGFKFIVSRQVGEDRNW